MHVKKLSDLIFSLFITFGFNYQDNNESYHRIWGKVEVAYDFIGIPNIGIHPYLLRLSVEAYQSGIRLDLYSYYLYSR